MNIKTPEPKAKMTKPFFGFDQIPTHWIECKPEIPREHLREGA
jgi:hypothetical protein